MATRKSDHKSTVHPDIPNKPGVTNWVEQAGGLPKYIERVAKHIHHDSGYDVSSAIAAAVSQTKKRAAKGNAQAVRAIAQWQRMKAKKMSVSKEYRKSAPTTKSKTGGSQGYPIKDRKKLMSAVRLYKMHKSKYSPEQAKRIRSHILGAAKKLDANVNLSNDNPFELALGRREFNENLHRRGPGGKFAPKGGGSSGQSKVNKKPTRKTGPGQTAMARIERLNKGQVFDIPGVDGQIKRTDSGFEITGPNGFKTTASSAAEAMAVAARVLKKSSKKDAKVGVE